MAEVDVAALRQAWEECLRLVDGERVKEKRQQTMEYYKAQSRMMGLLYGNAGELIDAYERVERLERTQVDPLALQRTETAAQETIRILRERVAKLERVAAAAREVADVPCMWTPQPPCGECDWCRIRAALAALDEEKGGE